MEAILKSINWEIYPETLNRLEFFKQGFKSYFKDKISDEDLDSTIALSFGIYGESHVYDIYMKLKDKLNGISFKDIFESFVNTFKETIPETFSNINPKNLIELFIEYIYSLVIKNI